MGASWIARRDRATKIIGLYFLWAAFPFLLYGCASPYTFENDPRNVRDANTLGSSSTLSAPTEEDQWASLIDGMEIKYNKSALERNQERYGGDFSEMRISNDTRLRLEKWESYLKDYLLSFSPEKRDDIADGITRYFHEYDRVDQVIRIEPLRFASGPYSRSSYVSMRGTLRPNSADVFLRLRHYGRNWLFANRVTVSVDGERIELGGLNFNRDHAAGNIWEQVDLNLSNSRNRRLAERIASGSEVIIRFHGRQYYSDFEPSDRMKDDINAMLRAVDAINN